MFSKERLICFFVVLRFSAAVNISWVLAEPGETEPQACIRNNMFPINMDRNALVWDEPTFRDVVTNILNMNVSTSSTNGYGIEGCCAPGLWCRENGECFTQGFSAHFSNFGWLPSDNTAKPVYTCAGTYNPATAVIRSAVLNNGKLSVSGSNIALLDSTTSAFVYGETCTSLETCNCLACDARALTPQCPPGYVCLWNRQTGFQFCVLMCSNADDLSCSCDHTCRPLNDQGTSTISVCFPPDATTYRQNCAVNNDNLQCNAARAYQSDYKLLSSANTDDYPVSVMTGDVGALITVNPTAAANTIGRGFCKVNSDCADGYLATRDTCDPSTGLCAYSSETGLDSTVSYLTSHKTPFMYYTYYSNSSSLALTQANSAEYIRQNGIVSLNSKNDDYPFQPVTLGFDIVFFGNKINEGYISPDGVLSLPPIRPCNEDQCILFSTSTNIIAPYHADWDPSHNADSSIIYFRQDSTSPEIFGVAGTALHVLWTNVVHHSSANPPVVGPKNTFAASVYSDSSVRLSFIDISEASTKSDFSGLWGSYVSSLDDTTESTNLLYHNETVPRSLMVTGSEILYCSMGSSACPVESCVAPQDTLQVRWNGTTTCAALGDDFVLAFRCVFVGGVEITPATFHAANESFPYSIVSCPVPALNFSDGSVIEVSIEVTAVRVATSGSGNDVAYAQNIKDDFGTKTVFGVYRGTNGEIDRANVLLRYYTNSAGRTSCGCNALPGYPGAQCDSLGVCGGQDTTKDCAGTPFGRALVTACNECAAGMTGITPVFFCEDDNTNNMVSQTIVLLLIICALSFLVVSVSYSIRRMLILRSMNEDTIRFNEAILAAENSVIRRRMGNNGARGLSAFECEALGEVEFTEEFYQKHRKEQHKLLHPVDDVALDNSVEPSSDVATDSAVTVVIEGDLEAGASAPAATSGSSSSSSCECSICLMDIEVGTKCRALPAPCGHIFHVECIDQWFQQSSQCPLCKRSVRAMLLGNDETETDETEDVRTEIHFSNGNLTFRIIPLRRSNNAPHQPAPHAPPQLYEDEEEDARNTPTRHHRPHPQPQHNRRRVEGFVPRGGANHLRSPSPVPSSQGHTTSTTQNTRAPPGGAARSDVQYQEMRNTDDSADSSADNL
mmetsp:Transcript_155/g.265  ORF Transcript_155/g.265 Transcript_155/m.265 type:complete len:1124 (-) Transcript_155:150-3521(-)